MRLLRLLMELWRERKERIEAQRRLDELIRRSRNEESNEMDRS